MKEGDNGNEYLMALRVVSVEEASRLGVKIDMPVFTYDFGSRYLNPAERPMTSIESGGIKVGDIISSAQVQQRRFEDKMLHLYLSKYFRYRSYALTNGFVAVVTPQGEQLVYKGIGMELVTDSVRIEGVRACCTADLCKRHYRGDYGEFSGNVRGYIVKEGVELTVLSDDDRIKTEIGRKYAEKVIPYAFQITNGRAELGLPNYSEFTTSPRGYVVQPYF